MPIDPKTIDGQIECLARLTEAPQSFVEQVRSLFTDKGISLAEDATPYVSALETAFRREESIRRRSSRTQQSLSTLNDKFGKLSESYRRQLKQLQQLRGTLRDYSQTLQRHKKLRPLVQDRSHAAERRGRSSSRGRLIMVPGPKDPQ